MKRSDDEVVALLVLTHGAPMPRVPQVTANAPANAQYSEVSNMLYKLGYDIAEVVRLRREYYERYGLNSGSPIDAPHRKHY